MSETVQAERWNHTASLLATMENTALGKKGSRVHAKQRHPFVNQSSAKQRLTESSLDAMVGL